tara:strand:- start:20247 stop:20567 length:321 start_codon:yes stop_codon:yes gene_type:complete
MSTIKISDNTFEEEVITKGKPIIVDFWAEWCGPCKQIGPILEEISEEYKEKIKIGKLDVDENPEVAGKYQIRGIPTMMLFNNGSLIDTKVGMSSKNDLINWIDQHI